MESLQVEQLECGARQVNKGGAGCPCLNAGVYVCIHHELVACTVHINARLSFGQARYSTGLDSATATAAAGPTSGQLTVIVVGMALQPSIGHRVLDPVDRFESDVLRLARLPPAASVFKTTVGDSRPR